MLTALRGELRAKLEALTVPRCPVLRRAREDEWLFASDLPALAEAGALRVFLDSLRADGWSAAIEEDGWLRLDHALPLPEDLSPVTGLDANELDCLISLLLRHPSLTEDPVSLRRLAKAREEGANALNRALAGLHGTWAERLRQDLPLPGAMLPYLMRMRESAVSEPLNPEEERSC